MDTYENENRAKPRKRSPYENSPYECAFTQQSAPAEPKVVQAEQHTPPKRKRRGVKPLVVILLLVVFCLGTAVGVSFLWQEQMEQMELAMNERFNVLQQLYEESKDSSGGQISQEGPMTPGEVYAQNVNAVVAVYALYSEGESIGSGFIISEDGYVVTNYHVIDGASQISVVPHSGKAMAATLVGYDDSNDVAVLKVNGTDLPYVTLGSSNDLAVGDQVAVIGNPLGDLDFSLTVGYISAKDRVINTGAGTINMLQTDAAINSGNSGGPLFDMNGHVIGIITAKRSGNSGSGVSIEGLGFAIPMDDVIGIISDLKTYGYVTGAYLGVYVRDVDVSAQSYGLPAGAFVESTEKGFAADRGGIRAGDIIVAMGGYEVDSVNTLTRVLRKFHAGDKVSVVVYRSGRAVYLSVTLDEKPIVEEQTTEEPQAPEEGNIFDEWWSYIFP